MAAIAPWLYEKRPLKKPRLGPPDVYPQDPRQKEDEITAINVKQGFNSTQIPDECGSARNQSITTAKFGAFFSAVLAKKQEFNTIQDVARKKPQVNPKENFFPVTARSRAMIDAWFKDLAGSKPLSSLSKKVPIFNKKEEIFSTLFDFNVPMVRAAWLLKMTSAYTIAISEAKIKKRQLPDPSQEWTHTLCKYMKEILAKLVEHVPASSFPPPHTPSTPSQHTPQAQGTPNSQSCSPSPVTQPHTPAPPVPTPPPAIIPPDSTLLKQWVYCTQLANHCYQEGLLDQQDFLQWILELIDRAKIPDDLSLRITLPLALDYSEEFVRSEILSRRLAHYCAKKINLLVADYIPSQNGETAIASRAPSPVPVEPQPVPSGSQSGSNQPQPGSSTAGGKVSPTTVSNVSPSPPMLSSLAQAFVSCLSCPHHRSIFFQLSTLIQVVVLECPTALVWHGTSTTDHHHHSSSSGKDSSSSSSSSKSSSQGALSGSPLDLLPCAPSQLPLIPNNSEVRTQLRAAEQMIIERSIAAEARWSCEKQQCHAAGANMTHVLDILDMLDRHSFDRVDSNSSLDTLYSKIFEQSAFAADFEKSAIVESPSKSRSSGGSSSSMAATTSSVPTTQAEQDTLIAKSEPLIRLLCEWSVTTKRRGEHRAIVVAKLLERRQQRLSQRFAEAATALSNGATGGATAAAAANGGVAAPATPTSNGAGGGAAVVDGDDDALDTPYLFQDLLIRFLDTQAPVIEEKSTTENRVAFANLILLFSELIRCDVFSHDAYMCTLISRGYFTSTPIRAPGLQGSSQHVLSMSASIGGHSRSVQNTPPAPASLTGFLDSSLGPSPSAAGNRGDSSSLPMFEPDVKTEVGWGDGQMDMDDARLDADLDKLLQHIKEGQKDMGDQPELFSDSVGSDKEDQGGSGPGLGPSNASSHGQNSTLPKIIRHLQYTTHFPLPPSDLDGGFGGHECNQRHILLYGVGKARDEARRQLKRATKDVMKLFTKKAWLMDVADGGKVKRHAKDTAKDTFNMEAVTARFQALSYFDQQLVTAQCASSVLELMRLFGAGASNHLPLVEYVSFLFSLMEISYNITGLLEFCLQLIGKLIDVECQLKGTPLANYYVPQVTLCVVGLLYRYHCCLLLSPEMTLDACDSLCQLIHNVTNPSECSSAERCILCYLHDLYSSCQHVKLKYQDSPLSSLVSRVKQLLYASQTPLALNLTWKTGHLIENLNNPRARLDPAQIKQLNENPTLRYSFVCNAVENISTARDSDRLNDISLLCAELTAGCPALSCEWLGVLKSLCCSSNHACGFIDVLTQVDVNDLSIHDNLAVFTSLLVARRCFSLQDFVVHVAIPALLSASPVSGAADPDAESGARLTCHLLLRLFRAVESVFPGSSAAPLVINTVGHPNGNAGGAPGATGNPPGAAAAGGATSQQPGGQMPPQKNLYVIRSACDRQLLLAAHNSMRVEPVLAVLKAILVLGDACVSGDSKGDPSIRDLFGPSDDGDFDLDMPFGCRSLGGNPNQRAIESAGLKDFAKYALAQICSQQWIHERCLRDPDILCSSDLLLDPMLTNRQAEYLLGLICHPAGYTDPWRNDAPPEQRQQIVRILQGLDQWSLRISWLQLQLMYQQCNEQSPVEVTHWQENVAKATVDVFQMTSDEKNSNNNANHNNNNKSSPLSLDIQPSYKVSMSEMESIWFVAPLIGKLPAAVQGKILRQAGTVLESSTWTPTATGSGAGSSSGAGSGSAGKSGGNKESFNSSSSASSKDKQKDKEKSTSLLNHQPFLSLVLMCLKGQDEQRESLLNSLSAQLNQCIYAVRDEKAPLDDLNSRRALHEALLLRLSLVGGMFDMLQRNYSLTADWAIIFVQLLTLVVVNPHAHKQLYYTVLDMLAALVHTTAEGGCAGSGSTGTSSGSSSSSSSASEESRRQYQALVKKIKKEVVELEVCEAVKSVHQLLPLPKQQYTVITCEPMGSLIDTKGNKIQGFDSIDKKQGLQVAEKQTISPWDLMEGHRNPAPLLWKWFGAVRIERKPTRHEENQRYLTWHTHNNLRKPLSYFIEPPQLPPEDLDPPQPPQIPQQQALLPPTMTQVPPHHAMPGRQVTPPQMMQSHHSQYPNMMAAGPPQNVPPHAAMQQQAVPQPSQLGGPSHPGMGPPPPHHQQPMGHHHMPPQMMDMKVPPQTMMMGGMPPHMMAPHHDMMGPMIGSVSPPTTRGVKKPKQPRRPRKAKASGPRGSLPPPPPQYPTGTEPPMYGQPQGPPQAPQQGWYGGPPQVPPQQQNYYQQQPTAPQGGPRFERQLSQSKAALSSMLRARQPQYGPMTGAQTVPGGAPQQQPQPQQAYPGMDMLQKQRQQMMMRQQMGPGGGRGQPPVTQTGMYNPPVGNAGPANQGAMGAQQQSMGGQYSNFPAQMDQPGPGQRRQAPPNMMAGPGGFTPQGQGQPGPYGPSNMMAQQQAPAQQAYMANRGQYQMGQGTGAQDAGMMQQQQTPYMQQRQQYMANMQSQQQNPQGGPMPPGGYQQQQY